jgi:Xaa-Pro aminopeptidase
VKSIAIDPKLFTANRERLLKLLPEKSLAILNANDLLPSNADGLLIGIPNSDLFYLTGVGQEETILVLAPNAFDPKNRVILFVRQPNEHLAIWEGHKLTKDQARALSGIQNIQWLSDFSAIFRQLMCESELVFLDTNEHQRAVVEVESRNARFIRDCQAAYPLHQYRRLAPLLYKLRSVKSPEEIAVIQQACDLTGKGFNRVLKFIQPEVNEAEIEAEFAHEFIRNKGEFAYPPIIVTGVNNCILHYHDNDKPCHKGDLVLMDVAAGIGNYMSDLTRTVPASGRFTRRQKDVYNAVLRVFRQMLQSIKPGKTTRDLRRDCEEFTTKECVDLGLIKMSAVKKQDPENPVVRKYFMHGVSHPIGLDVHDVTYNHLLLEPGWVVTCEPGIYIQEEGFGIRLENTVLVTDNGTKDLMAGIPIEADEIESIMSRGK